MIPVSPVLSPEWAEHEVGYGKGQPEYTTLPAIRNSTGVVLSRWKLSDEERKAVSEGADMFLSVWTFGQPLQPLRVEIGECDHSIIEFAEQMGLIP